MGNSMYDYGFDSSASDLENFISMMGAEETTTSPLSLILNILTYVLLSIGLYTIAKRRGIKNPWMAWIPIASTWLLGCISDQYRYIVHHEEKSKRKIMLVLEILMAAVCIVMIVLLIVMIPDLILLIGEGMESDLDLMVNNGTMAHILQMTGWVSIAALVTMGLGIALCVLTFMAYYDLFASCDPNNKTIYLVLGIIFSFLMSIFVFVCRKKDFGMPPRRDETPSQPAMWTPPQQTWQPPQPPVEPWEQNQE